MHPAYTKEINSGLCFSDIRVRPVLSEKNRFEIRSRGYLGAPSAIPEETVRLRFTRQHTCSRRCPKTRTNSLAALRWLYVVCYRVGDVAVFSTHAQLTTRLLFLRILPDSSLTLAYAGLSVSQRSVFAVPVRQLPYAQCAGYASCRKIK